MIKKRAHSVTTEKKNRQYLLDKFNELSHIIHPLFGKSITDTVKYYFDAFEMCKISKEVAELDIEEASKILENGRKDEDELLHRFGAHDAESLENVLKSCKNTIDCCCSVDKYTIPEFGTGPNLDSGFRLFGVRDFIRSVDEIFSRYGTHQLPFYIIRDCLIKDGVWKFKERDLLGEFTDNDFAFRVIDGNIVEQMFPYESADKIPFETDDEKNSLFKKFKKKYSVKNEVYVGSRDKFFMSPESRLNMTANHILYEHCGIIENLKLDHARAWYSSKLGFFFTHVPYKKETEALQSALSFCEEFNRMIERLGDKSGENTITAFIDNECNFRNPKQENAPFVFFCLKSRLKSLRKKIVDGGENMFDITSRMILLLEKVPNGLTTAEIVRIMGLSYDDTCNVLSSLKMKDTVIKKETRIGYVYSLNDCKTDGMSI